MIYEINVEELREDLIAIYELYIKLGSTSFIRIKADKIYTDCKNATNILEENLVKGIGALDEIAWPEMIAKTQRPGMTKERAASILEGLKVK